MKKTLSILVLVLALLVTFATPAEAVSKVKLSMNGINLAVGQSKTVTVKGDKIKSVKSTTSGVKVKKISATKIQITCKKADNKQHPVNITTKTGKKLTVSVYTYKMATTNSKSTNTSTSTSSKPSGDDYYSNEPVVTTTEAEDEYEDDDEAQDLAWWENATQEERERALDAEIEALRSSMDNAFDGTYSKDYATYYCHATLVTGDESDYSDEESKYSSFVNNIIASCTTEELKYQAIANWLAGKQYGEYGTCSNFSHTFGYLAWKAGLQAYTLTNRTHAFNAVRIDGQWYFVEPQSAKRWQDDNFYKWTWDLACFNTSGKVYTESYIVNP